MKKTGNDQTLRDILRSGDTFLPCDGKIFTEHELRQAWFQLRKALMEEDMEPGRRPYGFLRFELGVDTFDDRVAIEALDVAGFLSPEESLAVENQRPAFAQRQKVFGDPSQEPEEWVRMHQQRLERGCGGTPWTPYSIRYEIQGHEIAARWHARRGRANLQEKYEQLAQIARNFLERST